MKLYPISATNVLSASCLCIALSSASAFSAPNTAMYYTEMKKTREDLSDNTSQYVYDKLMRRELSRASATDGVDFGVHGMEIPAVKSNRDRKNVEKAFELLSRVGVNSLRSAETAWHRVADKEGNPTNFTEVDFQLKMAKKYGMTHNFLIGYPPAKYTVGHNKLSAVAPQYYDKYKNYLDVTLKHLAGYNVKYVELGNEVDAPSVWWINSTPAMYVNEMKMLKQAIQKSGQNIKTVAFSATYSRSPFKGGLSGGRRFVEKSFKLGINNYADAYSIHHYVFGADDLPDYMRSMASKYGGGNKPILDTEQLDTSSAGRYKSNPYDLVKLFARGYYVYGMKRVDYFMAKDRFINNKLYYFGLFDEQWKPKLRLLAYAMAVDAMKGKHLLFMASPAKDVEAYVLQNNANKSGKKYTILMWKNSFNNGKATPVIVKGIKGNVTIENWNLDLVNQTDASKGINLDEKPIAIYTDEKPDWQPVDNKYFSSNLPTVAESRSPMPSDK
ncbi:hypothetical protein CLM71_07345 [Serratia sp. MYb239]|uniref:hypothetical protein n=1 Tax=Serratia sp. MYb239 TaxID=2033438 RepID=UPI000CF6F4DC|nr:hypothetical protein [Serratia sp. MYb239]AVJ16958.1 hypothetical protein CLM71_07345 [Serratia sp. MYb239]MCA4822974.1 arabinogalactan endo-1,4-beta-galactosidase [Serratia rubidaea]SQJ23087.1 Beta-xylosidase [Serratia rubidaea]